MAIGAINKEKKLENPYIDKITNIINLTKNGYELDLKFFDFYHFDKKQYFFNEKLEELLGMKRLSKEPLSDEHVLIAEAVQYAVETTIDHLIEIGHKESGLNKLCLSGGVAMNSLYNGKIVSRHDFIDDVFISSCPDDSGVSIGAALFKYYEDKDIANIVRDRQVDNNWGTEYSNQEIRSLLDSYKVKYTYMEDNQL